MGQATSSDSVQLSFVAGRPTSGLGAVVRTQAYLYARQLLKHLLYVLYSHHGQLIRIKAGCQNLHSTFAVRLSIMTSKSRSTSPSDLSELPDEFEASDHDMVHPPPFKRRRLGTHLRASPTTIDSPSSTTHHIPPPLDDVSDVSSDSEASVPGSPRLANIPGAIQDEDAVGAEQMRLCSWDGCNAGELTNQDDLVVHVHNEHVNNAKKAKFACEWTDCKAKGKAQMSAYALRAHIRSHTKEKPFYCLLPGMLVTPRHPFRRG